MGTAFTKMVNWLERAAPRWAFLAAYGTHAAAKNAYNLLIRYGLMKSSYLWASVDREGAPIPWFSYPAVEYLHGLDLSELSVLEFGSGFSTLYWSRRARAVLSIEDDAEWAKRLRPMLGDNARIRLVTAPADYPTAIDAPEMTFGLIVIDGSSRLECAQASLPRLRHGGTIILDDADDYPDVAAALRAADLLQVDFAGFNPINTYTKTTSFFFHRAFQPKPRGVQLPLHSMCHPDRGKQNADEAPVDRSSW